MSEPLRGENEVAAWQDGWRSALAEGKKVLETKGAEGLVAWLRRVSKCDG